MSKAKQAINGATIFDGHALLNNRTLLLHDGRFRGIVDDESMPADVEKHHLEGGYLIPGYVDLQVNGGGGVMFNDNPSQQSLKAIANAHVRLGTTSFLPTLITDTPARTQAAIDAVEVGLHQKVSGVRGLHLEGPHLSRSKSGAHAPDLIRAMDSSDLEQLLSAKEHIKTLKVTLSPESASNAQIRQLSEAGIVVSLGHTNSTYEDCLEAVRYGASCVTHLYNAMSQLDSREPGLVGAALATSDLNAGIIVDGIHVHPVSLSLAVRAKADSGNLFLVSDAMATAGSDIESFELNGRTVEREGDRLSLTDGTLAGAHLDLTKAIRYLVHHEICDLQRALTMATSVPARVINREHELGTIRAGLSADFLWIDSSLELKQVWSAGKPLL